MTKAHMRPHKEKIKAGEVFDTILHTVPLKAANLETMDLAEDAGGYLTII
jgi:hypothetical protein